jgi:hypothetical protein
MIMGASPVQDGTAGRSLFSSQATHSFFNRTYLGNRVVADMKDL